MLKNVVLPKYENIAEDELGVGKQTRYVRFGGLVCLELSWHLPLASLVASFKYSLDISWNIWSQPPAGLAAQISGAGRIEIDQSFGQNQINLCFFS
jgi:hypothetical protein